MTIDEMIATCEEGSKATWNGRLTQGALEHYQLAEWLKELKSHREAWEKVRKGLRDKKRDSYFIGIYDAMKIVDKYRPKEGDAE